MFKYLKATVLISLFLSFSAFSYSYTACSIMTGKGTLAFNPFWYTSTVDGIRTTGSDLLLAYGITDKLDLWYDIGNVWSDGSTSSFWTSMVRYDLYKGHLLALKFDPSLASLQYQNSYENSVWGFQTNAVVQGPYETPEKVSEWAILCPFLKVGTGNDIFCEVNPGYYSQDGEFSNFWLREKGFGLDIIPGIGFTIRDVLFSAAVPVYDITNKPSVAFGVWAFFAITK